MFGWNRKSEGSDIRTTFEVRREQIRQRVLGAGRAVGSRFQATGAATAAGLRAAGAAVLSGARAGRTAAASGSRRVLNGMAAAAGRGAGLRRAGAVVLDAARAAGAAAAVGARRMLTGSAALAAMTSQKARAATGSLTGSLARPGVTGTLATGGAMALGVGIGRYRGTGLDSEAVAMLAIGGALTATLLPMGLSRLTASFPHLATPVVAMAAMGVAVLAAAAVWSAHRDTFVLAGADEGKEVTGRASVVAGDVLKVAGTTVRLSGIETPERAQLCGKDAGKWRCAEAAQSALSKVVSGRPVRCRLSGTDSAGRQLGHCSLDSVDINADLVRQGYAFAEGGAIQPLWRAGEGRTQRQGRDVGCRHSTARGVQGQGLGGGQAPCAGRLPDQGPGDRHREGLRAAGDARLRALAHAGVARGPLVLLGAGGCIRGLQGGATGLAAADGSVPA